MTNLCAGSLHSVFFVLQTERHKRQGRRQRNENERDGKREKIRTKIKRQIALMCLYVCLCRHRVLFSALSPDSPLFLVL